MFLLLLRMKISLVPHLKSAGNTDGWFEARPTVQLSHIEGSALAKQPCPADPPGLPSDGNGFMQTHFDLAIVLKHCKHGWSFAPAKENNYSRALYLRAVSVSQVQMPC